jgi:hypothetical protein
MKNRLSILIILCVLAIACNKETKIIQIENLTKIRTSFNIEKAEYFVIANPPEKRDELLFLTKQHIKSFALNDTIEKYDNYSHFYYKETRFTPRDYKEEVKDYFNHDYIDNHGRDLLITIAIYPTMDLVHITFGTNAYDDIELVWSEQW